MLNIAIQPRNFKSMKFQILFILAFFTLFTARAQTIADSIVLRDIPINRSAPAKMVELNIPSEGYKLQGLMYQASGSGLHPTIFLLHGFPGNERNLDLAQVLRANGWNVVYFNYRGAWGSQGQFSFKNCVADVVNAVHYIERESVKYNVDTNNIVLFGHSMGGWVTLKSIQLLPEIKKAFALSTWDIAASFKQIKSENDLLAHPLKDFKDVFVLNTTYKNIFMPVVSNLTYYDLSQDAKQLARKSIVVLDEHNKNEHIVKAIKKENGSNVLYLIWDTDHPFTNKRASLINTVLKFLNN